MSNLTFGQAVELLKQGKHVARSGWNGKGMFLFLVKGDSLTETLRVMYKHEGLPVLDAIYMKTADDKLVPWLASQTDVLSEDWTEA